MKERLKAPELRFPGFTDDWEQRKLNEVSDIYDGTHQTPKYQDDGVMFLSVENIKTLTSNKFISREAFEDEFKIRPQRGDVLMTRIGDIGTANVVETDEDLAYYVSLALFKSEELNPYFLQASIYAPFVQDQIWKRTLHIAFPKKINKNAIGQVPINVPTLAEQTKIGSFFKQLDDTITLHQRKLDLLKEQKKGYLQKMFPKNGAKVPELRFAGFADDWEERKLGDHAKYRRGSFPQPYGNKEWYDGEGAMPFVQVVDVTNKLTLVENTKQKISKLAQSKSVFVPKGKVVVTLQGSIGRVAITQYDSFVDRTLLIFEDYEKETDERFWAYTIQKKFEIEKLKAPGGTIKTITKEALSSFDVHLPKFEEQQKIGSFFKQLDETIALHQRKLDLLKEQKKGFLQKMFV
ncbi:Type I restriction-modification system specificity subunit S [Lactococcus lactis subsp. lactis]|uniref:Type I restriction-modification system specificity subunit S n=1 Tax=Lactococcus lactis subsp. lactis TaxID=1360 RepID=A0A0V8DS84_LACLL|nr:restriction endonuclease subunit S [Lactococcus lactis]KSU16428.1 Type I restriction-modification system specificity subunit S [Lactococcus lactis subsp. lactis]